MRYGFLSRISPVPLLRRTFDISVCIKLCILITIIRVSLIERQTPGAENVSVGPTASLAGEPLQLISPSQMNSSTLPNLWQMRPHDEAWMHQAGECLIYRALLYI